MQTWVLGPSLYPQSISLALGIIFYMVLGVEALA